MSIFDIEPPEETPPPLPKRKGKKVESSDVAVFVDSPPLESPDPPVHVETPFNDNNTIWE